MARQHLNMKTKTYKVRIDLEQETTSPRQALEDAVDYVCENHGDIVGTVMDAKGNVWATDLAVDGPALKVKLAHQAPEDCFTQVDMITLLEMVRIGLRDSIFRGCLAAELDLADPELNRLEKRLEKFLNPRT